MRHDLLLVSSLGALALCACQSRDYNGPDSKRSSLFLYVPWELTAQRQRERPKNEMTQWEPLQCAGGNLAIVDADPSYSSLVRLVLRGAGGDRYLPLTGAGRWMAQPGSNRQGDDTFAVTAAQVASRRLTQNAGVSDVAQEMARFGDWVEASQGGLDTYGGFVVRNRYRQLGELLEGADAHKSFYDWAAGGPYAGIEIRATYRRGTSGVGYDQGGTFEVDIKDGPSDLNGKTTLQCTNEASSAQSNSASGLAVSQTPALIEQFRIAVASKNEWRRSQTWSELKVLVSTWIALLEVPTEPKVQKKSGGVKE